MIMQGLETVASRAAAVRMTEADAEVLASLVSSMDAALEDYSEHVSRGPQT